MPPKMSKAKTPEALLAEQSPALQKVMKKLSAFVESRAPKLTPAVKWGGVCWIGKGVVVYAHPLEDSVSFGFFKGARLKDPKGVLEGKGKFVRSINVKPPGTFPEREMAGLLKQAVELDR